MPARAATLSGGSSVKCRAHLDGKNGAVAWCGIAGYGNHNSRTRFHMCIPDLGIVIEFKAGFVVFLPSALLVHFNVHLSDLEVWSTEEGAELNVEEEVNGQERRGSIIFFTQANMFLRAEHGMSQKEAGGKLKSDWTIDDFKRGMSAEGVL